MTDQPLIDISPKDWAIVRNILRLHVPDRGVWAFGSRAAWRAKQYSDLDLAVVGDSPLPISKLAALSDDFQESPLPFKIDLVDLVTASQSFRDVIERTKVLLLEPLNRSQFSVNTYRVEQLIAERVLEVGDGYRAKNSELSSSGVPFARAGNINDGLQFQNVDYFPEEQLHKVGNKVSRAGDVVFTSKGTVGRFAYVNEDVQRFVYSPQLCFWRSLNTNRIDPRFLYYWMQSAECLDQLDYLKGQTDMADYVSLRDQRRMMISLPAISVQREIAEVLSGIDVKISVLRDSNTTLESIANTLFKSWFVDFDPVRAKGEGREPEGVPPEITELFPSEFEDSEIGEIPKGWAVGSLDSIAKYLNGLALQKYPATDYADWLPAIKIAQLRKGSAEGADKVSCSIPPEYVIDDGDVIFSWSGSLEVAIWCGGKGALNQHLFKVSSSQYPKWFYYLWTLKHLPVFREIAASKATTMGHIQRHHLAEAKALVPCDDLISRLSEVISPILERASMAQLEARGLGLIRDALLPRLMSSTLKTDAAPSYHLSETSE